MGGLGAITCHAAIMDPYSADMELFDCFVKGESSREAASRFKRIKYGLDTQDQLVEDDVNDHYRMFHYLIYYLQRPHFFIQSCPVPLAREVRMTLLARYFSLDTQVCSDLYGKKPKELRSRTLSDRYQVENVKLIYKQIIKEQASGMPDDTPLQPTSSSAENRPLEVLIIHHFKLPKVLAETYAVLCFSIRWNFSIEKFRKVPALRSWDNLQTVTATVMQQFCENHANISQPLEDALRHVKETLKDSVLDSYCENILLSLVPPGPRSAALPPKATKMVRSLVSSLISFAANLGNKLSSIFAVCESIIEESKLLEQHHRHGGIAFMEAAAGASLPDRPNKKGKVMTADVKGAWFKVLRTVLVVVGFMDSQGAQDVNLFGLNDPSAADPSLRPASAAIRRRSFGDVSVVSSSMATTSAQPQPPPA